MIVMDFGRLPVHLTLGLLMLQIVKDYDHVASTWKLATIYIVAKPGIIFELYVVVIVLADFGGVCLAPIGADGLRSTMLALNVNKFLKIIDAVNDDFYGKLMRFLQKLLKKIQTC